MTMTQLATRRTRRTGKTRKARKAATRSALKAAALACFQAEGVAQVSVGAIARAAGVAHGTFYVHFASKNALLGELLEEFNTGLAARLAPLWAGARLDALGPLVTRTAAAFLDHWAEHRPFCEAYVQHAARGLFVGALRDGINPPMAALLSTGLEALAAHRGVRLQAPKLLTQALLAMWLRVGLHHLFNPDVTRADAIETLVTVSLGAVRGAFGAAPRLEQP